MDIALIHPPSFYDFRKRKKYYGPISDVVPSTPVFDMYPAGFLSLASYLGKQGFSVGIFNIAARMVLDDNFNVEKLLKNIEAEIYGIDLHWLVHAQGAMEIAKIIKYYHPNARILLGGFSATYYYVEILKNFPFIDLVALGDTTEKTVYSLLEGIPYDQVPNLAYREDGKIKSTGINFVPESLDEFTIDYSILVKQAFKLDDFINFVPFARFLKEPIGAVIPFKGCKLNCISCGGSCYTYNRVFNRNKLGVKSPESVLEEIRTLHDYMKIPIFFIGDLQLLGKKYIEKLFKILKEEQIDTTLFFEFFTPPTREYLLKLRSITEDIILHISPETHNEKIRAFFGKEYTNDQLEKFIRNTLELDFNRLDLYFMVGISGQDRTSAVKTAEYIDYIYNRFGKSMRRKITAFIAPLAPFLDPGSKAFENPGKYGYNRLCYSLREHISLLYNDNWFNMLNYSTRYLSRLEIALTTYDAVEALAKIKIKHGILKEKEGKEILESVNLARKIAKNEKVCESLKIKRREIIYWKELYPSSHLLKKITIKFIKEFISWYVKNKLF